MFLINEIKQLIKESFVKLPSLQHKEYIES